MNPTAAVRVRARAVHRVLVVVVVGLVGAALLTGTAAAAADQASAGPGALTTIAGNGVNQDTGDGGPATSAGVNTIHQVASDSQGNIYILRRGGNKVRRVDARTGTITTVAGADERCEYPGDGGPATRACLSLPESIALDPVSGDLYIADEGHSRVREVDARTGVITTVAGTGRTSWSPPPAVEGQLATQVDIGRQSAMAVDRRGNLYLASGGAIRMMTPDGRLHLLGGPTFALAGGRAAAAQLGGADQLRASPDGALYFLSNNWKASSGVHPVIRRLTPDGVLTTVAGSGAPGGRIYDGEPALVTPIGSYTAIAVDPDGRVVIQVGYQIFRLIDGVFRVVAGTGGIGPSADGTPARAARLGGSGTVTVTPDGTVAFAEVNGRYSSGSRVRGVVPGAPLPPVADAMTVVAGYEVGGYSGDGGPGRLAQLRYPKSLAIGADGAVFVADTNNSVIRRIDADTRTVTTVVGTGAFAFTGDGPGASTALNRPRGVAVDRQGQILIADTDNSRIRRLDPTTGSVSTIAGNGRWGFGGDGGPATEASLAGPRGVTVGPDGSIYVADTRNSRVRQIDANTGIITTLATGTLSAPRDLAFSEDGETLFISDLVSLDPFTLNGRVYGFDVRSGVRRTVTGLRNPGALLADGPALLVAEAGGNQLVRISPRNVATPVAITTTGASWGTDLGAPQGLARAADGSVWVADSAFNRIVRIAPDHL